MLKKIMTLVLSAAAGAAMATTIHLAGDSTCAPYAANRAPLTGWGQVLAKFTVPGVKVNNRAVSGTSTKSFIDAGLWNRLLTKVQKGDFVIIQFGHNDQKSNKPKTYADAAVAYPANLRKMIADVRAKGATPVLATSIVRCTFRNGKLYDNGLYPYRNATFAVGKSENVAVVNLNGISEEKINALGEKDALNMYMYSSNVPKLKGIDKTHLTKAGAETFAKWFVDDCKAQKLPLAKCFK